jgi:hypothetical protein
MRPVHALGTIGVSRTNLWRSCRGYRGGCVMGRLIVALILQGGLLVIGPAQSTAVSFG